MLFPLTTWLGIGLDYILAAVLIAGGGYVAFVLGGNPINPLARLLHYVGLVLIAGGILIGAVSYGKARGAVDCEAAWKAKNYEAQIARLKQEAAAKDVAAQPRRKPRSNWRSRKTMRTRDWPITRPGRSSCKAISRRVALLLLTMTAGCAPSLAPPPLAVHVPDCSQAPVPYPPLKKREDLGVRSARYAAALGQANGRIAAINHCDAEVRATFAGVSHGR